MTADSTLDRNVATFNDSSAYLFEDIEPFYEVMKKGFSFETYIYLAEKPSSGYQNIASNQHAGGFGFEYTDAGTMHFYCMVGTSYQAPGAALAPGQWVHLVGTFDGLAVRMYINGELVDTKEAEGTFTPPPIANAHYLVLGGDSDTDGAVSAFMTGKIADVNLYSTVLTDAQIAELYAKY